MEGELRSLPNVGPAVARKLGRLGIERPEDLRGRDPDELFERLCALDGRPHDPCLLDTFVAVVSYADGGPAARAAQGQATRPARGFTCATHSARSWNSPRRSEPAAGGPGRRDELPFGSRPQAGVPGL